eukprot:g5405.t1
MRLHTSPGAPNPDLVGMYLAETENEHVVEVIRVNIGKAENRQPAFLEINPLGEVPALVLGDGTTCISESVVICEYIDSTTTGGRGTTVCGTNAQERAETAMWLRRIEDKILSPIGSAFQSGVMFDFFDGKRPVNRALVEPLAAVGKAGLAWLDGQLADGRQFLCGDRFCLADIRLFTLYSFFAKLDKAQATSHADFGHFKAYIGRVAARPSAAAIKPKKKKKPAKL